MKKAISVLLLACMLLTLTACGSQPAAPATDPTAEPAAEATKLLPLRPPKPSTSLAWA